MGGRGGVMGGLVNVFWEGGGFLGGIIWVPALGLSRSSTLDSTVVRFLRSISAEFETPP